MQEVSKEIEKEEYADSQWKEQKRIEEMQFAQKLNVLKQKRKRLMKEVAVVDGDSVGRFSLEDQLRTNSTTGQHLSLSNATFKELSNNSYTEMSLKQKKTKSQRPHRRFINSF